MANVICKIDPDDSIKKIFAKKVSEFYLKSNADFVYSNIIVNVIIFNMTPLSRTTTPERY